MGMTGGNESEVERLTAMIAAAMKLEGLTLTPVNVGCRWPVYRGQAPAGADLFIKVEPMELAMRTIRFLRLCSSCSLLPRLMFNEPLPFGNDVVLCLEWKTAMRVDAECMTEAQGDGLLQGCIELSKFLQVAEDLKIDPTDNPDYQYDVICAYTKRHRFAGKLLRRLTNLKKRDFSYQGRDLVVIHGDFHSKNYGFDGARLSAVFDIDEMTRGLACEDMAYAFTERCRKSSLGKARRLRLCRTFLRLVTASPWPRQDWIVAVNHARLRIAYKRLVSHPDSTLVAFDIARRDCPLRVLADVLRSQDA